MPNMVGGMVGSDGNLPPAPMTFATMPGFPSLYATGGPGGVALGTGAESVLLSGVLATLRTPSRLYVSASLNLGFGSTLSGTNGARVRLYVDNVQLVGSERHDQTTATLAVTVSFDANPVTLVGYVDGLAPGNHTIELRAIKTGSVSSVTVTGDRNLFAIEMP